MTNKDVFISLYKAYIKREGANDLLDWLEKSDFFIAPASTRFHLSKDEGLVTHSLHVYRRLKELYTAEKRHISGSYASLSAAEEESIAIVGLLHDLTKVNFYKKVDKRRKTDQVYPSGAPVWETYQGYDVDDSFPFGHGEKSVFVIMSHMKLTPAEALAIRYHMGFSDESYKGGGYGLMDAFHSQPLAVLTHIADMQATYLDEADEPIHLLD